MKRERAAAHKLLYAQHGTTVLWRRKELVGKLQGSRRQAKTREENDLLMSNTPTIPVAEPVAPLPKGERRRKRRAEVSLALRVRPADAKDGIFEEVRATRNASRDGLYFITPTKRYYEGMQLRVTVPYRPSAGMGSWENRAEVVRVEERADSRMGVAIRLLGAASLAPSPSDARPNGERRLALRHLISVPAEVVEPRSQVRLSARVSDLSLEGCYIDTLNPFPVGTTVQLRLLKAKDVFETQARVCSCQLGMGMGLSFGDSTPEQRAVLVGWLAEFDTQLEPASNGSVLEWRPDQPAETNPTLVVELIRLLSRKGILSHSEGLALLKNSTQKK